MNSPRDKAQQHSRRAQDGTAHQVWALNFKNFWSYGQNGIGGRENVTIHDDDRKNIPENKKTPWGLPGAGRGAACPPGGVGEAPWPAYSPRIRSPQPHSCGIYAISGSLTNLAIQI